METQDILIAQRAELDMVCECCHHLITMGEDFYYDQDEEETYCENCASEKENFYPNTLL